MPTATLLPPYIQSAGAFQVDDGTWRQPNGSVLSNSSTAGTFFGSGMGGNQRYYRGEDAQGNTKTDVMYGWFQLPVGYVAGAAITLRIAVGLAGSGTAGTCTVDAEVRKQAVDASVGSDLVTTAATAISGTFANKDFTITPTGLVAGDVFTVKLTTAVQETGGAAILVALVTNIEIRPVVRQFA